MEQLCYLCRKPIAEGTKSDDHVVPQHLLKRKQPKVKGFDYGGVLPTHTECNNRFGPEAYCAKALQLIAVLNDERCVSTYLHKDDPKIIMMALNSECLKGFTRQDLQFFKFIDVREKDTAEWSSPSFFSGKPKTDPIRDALFVALAVLAKSAAALLVSRHLAQLPERWRILAMPYFGATDALDFDSLFGKTKPFDIGVKVWLRALESGDWFTIFRAHNVLVFFLFQLFGSDQVWDGVLTSFRDAERLLFEGNRLTDLIDYQWQQV